MIYLNARKAPTPPPPGGGDYPAWAATLASHWDSVTISATSTAPLTIPHDGTTPASTALASWISAQPSGTDATHYRRYDLSPLAGSGGIYLDNLGIDLRGKSYVQLYIPGVDFKLAGDNTNNAQSWCLTGDSGRDIWIKGDGNGVIDGLNLETATTAVTYKERLNALLVRNGSNYVLVEGIRWDRLKGFGPGTFGDGSGSAPQNVVFRDCYVRGGEMGMCMTSGKYVWFDNCDIIDSQIMAFDIEPDTASHVVEDVLLTNFNIYNYGWYQALSPWSLATVGHPSVAMTRVMAADWTVRCPDSGPHGGSHGTGGICLRADGTNIKNDYILRRLWTDHPNTMYTCMNWDYVNNLEVTDCTVRIDGGSLTSDLHPSGTRNISNNHLT
jgi:hypothetical protein